MPAKSVTDYIASFPLPTQNMLKQLRQQIRHLVPKVEEKISYGMPAYYFHGVLVYFAGYRTHIGFYATPSGHAAFAQDLRRYKKGKGSVQFPVSEPLPTRLIERMLRFRMRENLKKAEAITLKAAKSKSYVVAKVRSQASRPARARNRMPAEVRTALGRESLTAAYKVRPKYQQNDYLGWIARAIRPETRQKRIAQMLDELRKGNVYMKMPWKTGSK